MGSSFDSQTNGNGLSQNLIEDESKTHTHHDQESNFEKISFDGEKFIVFRNSKTFRTAMSASSE
jgi:uncharacterized protein YllA (UPF0747 family)